MRCNNCNGSFDAVIEPTAKDNGIIIRQGAVLVAAICRACVNGVTCGKVSIRRADPAEPFTYDQYQPIESGKRFGG